MPAPAKLHPIVGTWRLLEHQTVLDDGEVVSHFGSDPRGRLIVTDGGYMMGFVVDSSRQAGQSDREHAALHRSMIAYSGTYRVAGDQFVVAVDLSWNQMWDGTEQARTFQIEGRRLHILSAPGPSALRPGRNAHSRLLWERETAAISGGAGN